MLKLKTYDDLVTAYRNLWEFENEPWPSDGMTQDEINTELAKRNSAIFEAWQAAREVCKEEIS